MLRIVKNINKFISCIPKYKPLVISGCSGAGKSTLINFLTDKHPQHFQLNPSHTTRAPRPGETPGKDYIFISPEQFQQNINRNEYIEYFNVHGNMYGTHMRTASQIICLGKICVLDMDIQGGEEIHRHYPEWNFIFVKCESENVLKQRLNGRGTDTREVIERRLRNAELELRKVQQLKFYTCIVNDEIETAKRDLLGYVDGKYGLDLGKKRKAELLY